MQSSPCKGDKVGFTQSGVFFTPDSSGLNGGVKNTRAERKFSLLLRGRLTPVLNLRHKKPWSGDHGEANMM
jgi:hypothetical protein